MPDNRDLVRHLLNMMGIGGNTANLINDAARATTGDWLFPMERLERYRRERAMQEAQAPQSPPPAPAQAPAPAGVQLHPVDHDPFAVKLMPVEHDPFTPPWDLP